jgi:hypothetical protein
MKTETMKEWRTDCLLLGAMGLCLFILGASAGAHLCKYEALNYPQNWEKIIRD